MRAYLHGVRRVDMKDDSGRNIKGFTCFFSYPSDGVEGEEVDRKFISDELASSCAWSPAVGKMIELDFTPKAKVCGIRTVNEK